MLHPVVRGVVGREVLHIDAILRETEGLKEATDLELQREVHRDPQRTELEKGYTIDGFTKRHTEVLLMLAFCFACAQRCPQGP